MSMTREEAAIKSCEDRKKHLESAPKHHYGKRQCERAIELERVKIAALRPVSREQVEKVWMGKWIKCKHADYYVCNKCSTVSKSGDDEFCKSCGRAMTDEAVDMVMERIEALDNETQ